VVIAGTVGDGIESPRPGPTRVCPHCAALSQSAGDFCPECGHSFAEGRRVSGISRRAKFAMLGVVLLLVLGGAGAAIAIKVHHDNQVSARQRSAAAAHARAAAAALTQQQAQQQQQADQAAQTTLRQGEETLLLSRPVEN
jgi:hypothetical protein